MTACKPEKYNIYPRVTGEELPEPNSRDIQYQYGFNDSHAEWTAYTDELLKPLEEVHSKYKNSPFNFDAQAIMWEAIAAVISKHREALS